MHHVFILVIRVLTSCATAPRAAPVAASAAASASRAATTAEPATAAAPHAAPFDKKRENLNKVRHIRIKGCPKCI